MRNLFVISDADVQCLARRKSGRELTIEELEQVEKGLEFGLECWEDVVRDAINEISSSKE